ncbi:hypothetical protein KJ756_02500 [Patescibacteria group bacterium]|nr:hypothetical protein [Patescibacteria group bacterium]
MITITFGDVFRYNSKEYIFLKITPDTIYAAWILNKKDSEKISSLYNRRISNGGRDLESRTIFAFVTLDTKEFKKRIASFHMTGNDLIKATGIEPIGISVSDKDIKELKSLIRSSPCVSKELKKDFVK